MQPLQLQLGPHQAVVDLVGGRVVAYEVAGRPVVVGEAPDEPRTYYRSSLLAPWPNRVTGGRWTWEGEQLQLPVNEPERGTALHGLVAYAPFDVVRASATEAVVAHDLVATAGYPFPLRVEASYRLEDEGLTCALRVVSTGDRDAPVALGVHPYLDCRGPVDEVLLTLPASTVVDLNESWDEVGRRPAAGSGLDFRTPRQVGAAAVDAAWTDLAPAADGRVVSRLRYPDGDEVELWGGPTTRWLVVYNGDTLPGSARRRSIAVEPCTGPANALRSGCDLDVLAPGAELELTWGVRASWL